MDLASFRKDIPQRRDCTAQFMEEVFETLALVSRKSPTCTKGEDRDEVTICEFHQKVLIKVSLQWKRWRLIWFLMPLHNYFTTKDWARSEVFDFATESGGAMGSYVLGTILPIIVPNWHRGVSHPFTQILFKFVRNWLSRIQAIRFHYWFCWSHQNALSRKRQLQWGLYQSQNISKKAKNWGFLAYDSCGLIFFSWTLHLFLGVNLAIFL